MMINSQNKRSKIKISANMPQTQQLMQQKMIYFRCSNKTTYKFLLKHEFKINLIKTLLSTLVSVEVEKIRLIHKGQEILHEAQLQNLSSKSVVHVAVLPNKQQKDIHVWINFFGKFSKKYLVNRTTKLRELVYFIKKSSCQLKNTTFLLIYLGKALDLSLDFDQSLIGDNAELYALDISVKEPIQQGIKKQLKQKSSQVEPVEVQAKSTNRAILDRPNIPLSNVFDVHRKQDKIFQQASNKTEVKLAGLRGESSQVTFDTLKSGSKAQVPRLSQSDFLFMTFESLPQSQNFMKNTINQMKQTLKRRKR